MTSTGTSIAFKSSVKSVSEKALMHSYPALTLPIMLCRHQLRIRPSETFAWPVEAVERAARNIEVKLGAVGGKRSTESVEDRDWRSARIGIFFDHYGRYRVDQHGLGHASGFRARHITCDLAATCRVADMNGILEVERRDKLSDIGCIGVHLVAAVGLVRPPVDRPPMSGPGPMLV